MYRITRQIHLILFFCLSGLVGCNNIVSTPSPSPEPTLTPENYVAPDISEQIGKYTIEIWNSQPPAQFIENMMYGYARLSATGMEAMVLQHIRDIYPLPATDITGEGDPDILLQGEASGSRTMPTFTLINLGETPTALFTSSGYRDHFVTENLAQYWFGAKEPIVDLDGDGSYEIIIRESVNLPCSQPSVPVLLGFKNGRYEAVTNQFPDWLEQTLAQKQRFAEEGAQRGGKESISRCDMLEIAFILIYAGRAEEAWALIDAYEDPEGNLDNRQHLEKALADPSLFLNQE